MRYSILAALAAGSILWTVAPLAVHHGDEKPRIQNAWVREVLPGQDITAAFLLIENPDHEADSLTGVSCECAKTMEMHRMVKEGDKMKMEPVEKIEVPARGKVELKPGGLHLMLFGTKPLRQGDKVRLRLRFTHAGEVVADVPVQAAEGKAGAKP